MQEPQIHMRTTILDAGKDVVSSIAAGTTTLLLEARVDTLSYALKLSTRLPHPRQVARRTLLGLRTVNLQLTADISHGAAAALEIRIHPDLATAESLHGLVLLYDLE